ncbi:unnamed protein product [Sympodiomycopsis kandeliae]
MAFLTSFSFRDEMLKTTIPRCSTPIKRSSSVSLQQLDFDDSFDEDDYDDLLVDSPSYLAWRDTSTDLTASEISRDELLLTETSSFMDFKSGSCSWDFKMATDADLSKDLSIDELSRDELLLTETSSFVDFKSGSCSWDFKMASNADLSKDLDIDELSRDEFLLEETSSFLNFKNSSFSFDVKKVDDADLSKDLDINDVSRDEFLLEETSSFLAFKNEEEEEDDDDDATLVLELGEDEEMWLADSPSFILFKGECDEELTKTSSCSPAKQEVIVAVEGPALSLSEDETKPKMQRLMAFWKAVEQKRS